MIAYRVAFTYRTFLSLFFQPVLVYSIAKTGTSSVKKTLRKYFFPHPVYHVHRMSWTFLKKLKQKESIPAIPPEWDKDLWTRNLIERTRKKIHWKVITLTREPIGRQVSATFEGLENSNLAGGSEEAILEQAKRRLNIQELPVEQNNAYFIAERWFDEELREVFGFDVYSTEFDRAAGYKIYKVQNADILVIRLEDLSRVGPQAFKELLGGKNTKIIKANERAASRLQPAYQQILDTITYPNAFLDRIYNGRYSQLFYSEEEITTFKKRWMKLS